MTREDALTLCAAREQAAAGKDGVTLQQVILEGLLPAPAQLFSSYRGEELSARVESDGTVTYQGKRYTSLSAAGGAARKRLFKGHSRGEYPATNGWTFWQVKDPTSGQPIAVDVLRGRLLKKKADEAKRFTKSGG